MDEYLEWDCPAVYLMLFQGKCYSDRQLFYRYFDETMHGGWLSGAVWQSIIIIKYLQRDYPAGVLKSFCRINVILTDHSFLLFMQRQSTVVGLAGLSSSISLKFTLTANKYLQRDCLAGVLRYFCRLNVILMEHYFCYACRGNTQWEGWRGCVAEYHKNLHN